LGGIRRPFEQLLKKQDAPQKVLFMLEELVMNQGQCSCMLKHWDLMVKTNQFALPDVNFMIEGEKKLAVITLEYLCGCE